MYEIDLKPDNVEEDATLPRQLLTFMLGAILLASVFTAGLFVGAGLDDNALASLGIPRLVAFRQFDDTPQEDVNLDTFWEVWNAVDSRFYYDVPNDEARMDSAIQGMLNSLDDPYTNYVSPEIARVLREDDTGSFDGIGAFVETAPDGGVYIVNVFEDGPADEAGIQTGDIVVEVDGQDIVDKDLNEALLLIRGKAGTEVTLTVVREGENDFLEFTVERARLEVPTIDFEMLDSNIGYIALYEFNAQASSRLRSAVRQLEDEGAEALILDLRNNPGGFLNVSIEVADLFLPEGVVVIQRDVDGDMRQFDSKDGDLAEDIPIVVLINGGSASASEIVAGAIKDRERGTILGTTSFGKGSVQLQYDLENDGILRVTYANWYTPNDISITEIGVEPDLTVQEPDDGFTDENDPQLDAAIEHLLETELD